MQLTRNINQPVGDLFAEFDRLFRIPFGRTEDRAANQVPRGFSLYESNEDWRLRADLPGFAKEDVEITVTDGVLRIAAKRGDNEQGFIADFTQDVKLPDDVAAGQISAHHENGVLEITLPKQEPPKPETTRININ